MLRIVKKITMASPITVSIVRNLTGASSNQINPNRFKGKVAIVTASTEG